MLCCQNSQNKGQKEQIASGNHKNEAAEHKERD